MSSEDALRWFEDITRIPRPSGHTERIGGYLESFAREHRLSFEKDDLGNILIRRTGAGPYITLQAHQDMVPASLPGYDFDFVNTPLETKTEDGWISARGTTLGADDGAGMAIILTALSSPELEGYPIEALFTVDEEVGLLGALGLSRNWLIGKYLVNIDSEDSEVITIGCAGSTDVHAVFSDAREKHPGFFYRLTVSGCAGGHSADMIDKGRSNAILLAVDVLHRLKAPVRLVSIDGGNVPNAIPISCTIEFLVKTPISSNDIDEALTSVTRLHKEKEPDLTVSMTPSEEEPSFSESFTEELTYALAAVPNGVIERDDFGVKTSSNIGVIRTEGNSISVYVKPRSSDMNSLNGLIEDLKKLMNVHGASVEDPSVLPAWHEDSNCPLLKIAESVYGKVFGTKPEIVVTHGGLECSVIKDRNPGITGAISIGPTITGAHSTQERMDVATLSRMSEYTFELIRELGRNHVFFNCT